jgi:hypothetical protein
MSALVKKIAKTSFRQAKKKEKEKKNQFYSFFVYTTLYLFDIMLRGASVVRNTARLTAGKSSRLYTVR